MNEENKSTFELRLATDNDAFVVDFLAELIAINDKIVERIRMGDWLNNKWHDVRDSNGNTCGQFRVNNAEMR
jgi:hypothetical protein